VRKKKKEGKKIEITGQKYNGLPYSIGGHNYCCCCSWRFSNVVLLLGLVTVNSQHPNSIRRVLYHSLDLVTTTPFLITS